MVTTVAFIDDDTMLLDALRLWAAGEAGIGIVASCSRVEDYLAGSPAEIVVLDHRLGDDSRPLENVRAIAATGAAVLVFSATAGPRDVAAALSAGADGFVEKSGGLQALSDAVRTIAAGELFLTEQMAFAISRDTSPTAPKLAPKEVAVLRGYASGLKMASVARQLGITESTALTYLRRVKEKYAAIGREAPTKLDLAKRWEEDKDALG